MRRHSNGLKESKNALYGLKTLDLSYVNEQFVTEKRHEETQFLKNQLILMNILVHLNFSDASIIQKQRKMPFISTDIPANIKNRS